jgi:hypothetical protein
MHVSEIVRYFQFFDIIVLETCLIPSLQYSALLLNAENAYLYVHCKLVP